MNKAMNLTIMLFLMTLCATNIPYSAEKNIIKMASTWDNTKCKKIKIKKPEVTVLKIIININEVLPMHKHDLVNIAYIKKAL